MKMKTKLTVILAAAVIGAAMTWAAAPGFLRVKWGGFNKDRWFNEQNQSIQFNDFRAGGISSPKTTFSRTYYYPEALKSDDNDVIVEDRYSYTWWGSDIEQRSASYWTLSKGGETKTYFERNFGAEPTDVPWFWGQRAEPGDRRNTIGGFDFGMENGTTRAQEAKVTMRWQAPITWPDETTRHTLYVPKGQPGSIAPRPTNPNWGQATKPAVTITPK